MVLCVSENRRIPIRSPRGRCPGRVEARLSFASDGWMRYYEIFRVVPFNQIE